MAFSKDCTVTQIAANRWTVKVEVERSEFADVANGAYGHEFIGTFAGSTEKELASGRVQITY